MGCWCSKDNPVHRPLSRLFSCSVASNDRRPLPSGPQRSTPAASFTSPSRQRPPELRVPEEQRRHSRPQTSTRQASQGAPSQRAAEAQSSHNLGRSPNSATPSAQYSEGVLGELEKLHSSVVDFVDRCFSRSNESLRSKARRTIYRLVLENAERQKNSQSRKCNILLSDPAHF